MNNHLQYNNLLQDVVCIIFQCGLLWQHFLMYTSKLCGYLTKTLRYPNLLLFNQGIKNRKKERLSKERP